MNVLVLAKEPVAGRVKTRLCPPCTAAEAAALAAAALADTLDAATGAGADRVVLALDGEPGAWLPAGVDVVAQGEGALGDRLAHAWSTVTGPTLQIGMDTPQVTAGGLTDALAVLADPAWDALLGPAVDGGWWAVGLRVPRPDAFRGVATSRSDTGGRQLARLRGLGLRVGRLPTRRDVDTFADAVAVAAAAPSSRFAACLRAMQAVPA